MSVLYANDDKMSSEFSSLRLTKIVSLENVFHYHSYLLFYTVPSQKLCFTIAPKHYSVVINQCWFSFAHFNIDFADCFASDKKLTADRQHSASLVNCFTRNSQKSRAKQFRVMTSQKHTTTLFADEQHKNWLFQIWHGTDNEDECTIYKQGTLFMNLNLPWYIGLDMQLIQFEQGILERFFVSFEWMLGHAWRSAIWQVLRPLSNHRTVQSQWW